MQNGMAVFDGDKLTLEDEHLDDLQLANLHILQKKNGFRYGMDAVLLSDFMQARPGDHIADFGTGTGILPLLLRGRGKGARYDAFEIQPEMADMAARTMLLNGLENVIHVHALPVSRADSVVAHGTLDGIICNPPYGQPGSTLKNPSGALRMARHQDGDGLAAWFRMAHLLLKGKGRMAIVYPAPRMLDAMCAMRAAHLEPKRFRLVYPRADKSANLALIECVKDARPMLHPEPPLIIYNRDGTETEELKKIYHAGIG